MVLSFLTLLTLHGAIAATPVRVDDPPLKAIWSGVPESFQTLSYHTSWDWIDEPHELGPRLVARIEASIHLPVGWELKSPISGATKLQSVKRSQATPGQWDIVAEQSIMDGGAELDFLDDHDKLQKLSVTIRADNRHPILVTKTKCDDFDVRLDSGIANAHFLYLVVNCSEFANEITVYFARSPDAHWLPAAEIKNLRAAAFEYKFSVPEMVEDEPKPKIPPRSFELRTQDDGGRRAEWTVTISSS